MSLIQLGKEIELTGLPVVRPCGIKIGNDFFPRFSGWVYISALINSGKKRGAPILSFGYGVAPGAQNYESG